MAYRQASMVVCLSRAIEAKVKELDNEIKTTIIPSSYSGFNHFPQDKEKIKEEYKGKFLIGQVGALRKHKGQHITIKAAHLLQDLPDIHFLFLGDGPDRKELEEKAKNLTNVNFLGHKKNIGPYFAAFDLFIFPSLSEGLGSSILEAMQAGVPVLASNTGGIPDIIEHAVTGWLIEPGDPVQLAQAIRHLYSNPELRTQLATQASERLHKFSPQSIGKLYLELYRHIISSK